MRELEGWVERPASPRGGGVIWYALRSCMRQLSNYGVTGALPSGRPLPAPPPLRRCRADLRFTARAEASSACPCALRLPAEMSRGGLARCALRAFFHALRATAACLRARLASLTRLRARFSSSLAIRTRCRATSASSLARSRGSAGSAAAGTTGVATGGNGSAPSLAADGGLPADRFSLAVFPIRNCGRGRGGRAVSHNGRALATLDLIHRICE